MKKLAYIFILFLGLLMGGSSGQELWDLGTSQDWLSTSIYSYYPYIDYYPYYGTQSGFAKFFGYYPYNYEPYWAYPYPGTYSWTKYLARPWWVGAHRDLPKVMDIARTRSSLRVYSGGAWVPP